MTVGLTPEEVRRLVAGRRAQGLPERVEDPLVLARLASFLESRLRRPSQGETANSLEGESS